MGVCLSKNNNAALGVFPVVNVNKKNENATAPDGNNDQPKQQPEKQQMKRKRKTYGRSVPIGLRTNFGYDRGFDKRYTVGKLLGHGQFGYTYSATDNITGELVAVKKIDKNKVPFRAFIVLVIVIYPL